MTTEARFATTGAKSLAKLWAKLAAVSFVMLSGIANAAEIKVVGSPGTREPYTLLVPGFEKATGHKVTTTWGGVSALAKRVADGEVADVVMLPAAQIDDLIKQGKLVADSRVSVATSGVGVAIRAGAPKIDASSSEGIRKALIAAKTIAFSAGPSGLHIERLIAKWGLTDQLKAKIVPPTPNVPIGEVVARGDAEIGFQQESELLPVKGIDYLGPLPADINEGNGIFRRRAQGRRADRRRPRTPEVPHRTGSSAHYPQDRHATGLNRSQRRTSVAEAARFATPCETPSPASWSDESEWRPLR